MKNDHTSPSTTCTARPGRFRRLAVGGALAAVASTAVIAPASMAFAGQGTPNPGQKAVYLDLCQKTHTPCDADGYPTNVDKGALIAHCGYLPPPFSDCDEVNHPAIPATPPPTQAPKYTAPKTTTPPPVVHKQTTPDVPVSSRPTFTG